MDPMLSEIFRIAPGVAAVVVVVFKFLAHLREIEEQRVRQAEVQASAWKEAIVRSSEAGVQMAEKFDRAAERLADLTAKLESIVRTVTAHADTDPVANHRGPRQKGATGG